MKRTSPTRLLLVALLVTLCWPVSHAQARSLEEILKDKGVITAEDYAEASKNSQVDYIPGKGLAAVSADGNYKLNIGGYAQFIYRYTGRDDQTMDDKSDFDIRRFKLQLKGYLFNKKFGYKYQGEMAGGFKTEDAYLNYKFSPALTLQVGQFKPPQARQELTSASKQLFPDRSLANDTFNLGRDQGLQASGSFADKLVQYRLGIFNGNGPNVSNPDNNQMYAGRIDINPLGSYKMDEAGWPGDKLELTLGGSFSHNTVSASDVAGNFDKDNDVLDKALNLDATTAAAFSSTYGSDLVMKLWTANLNARWQGATFAAEYYNLNADPDQGADWGADGYYLQAGYQVIPQRLELALRYAAVESTDADASAKFDKSETQFGVNYYFARHALKLQSDITLVEDNWNQGQDDTIFRLQAQFYY